MTTRAKSAGEAVAGPRSFSANYRARRGEAAVRKAVGDSTAMASSHEVKIAWTIACIRDLCVEWGYDYDQIIGRVARMKLP